MYTKQNEWRVFYNAATHERRYLNTKRRIVVKTRDHLPRSVKLIIFEEIDSVIAHWSCIEVQRLPDLDELSMLNSLLDILLQPKGEKE